MLTVRTTPLPAYWTELTFISLPTNQYWRSFNNSALLIRIISLLLNLLIQWQGENHSGWFQRTLFTLNILPLTWVLCLRNLQALNNRTYLLSHSMLLTFVVLKPRCYLRTIFSKWTSSFLNATILFRCLESINYSNSLAKLAGALNAAFSRCKPWEAPPYALIWS